MQRQTKERTEMIDIESELKTLTPEAGFRLYAKRLQVWRLCGSASCRRSQTCRGDPFRCCRRCSDWADSVKTAAMLERAARDPAVEAMRSDLAKRVKRLAASLRDES
jgi:hypothetical protein